MKKFNVLSVCRWAGGFIFIVLGCLTVVFLLLTEEKKTMTITGTTEELRRGPTSPLIARGTDLSTMTMTKMLNTGCLTRGYPRLRPRQRRNPLRIIILKWAWLSEPGSLMYFYLILSFWEIKKCQKL